MVSRSSDPDVVPVLPGCEQRNQNAATRGQRETAQGMGA